MQRFFVKADQIDEVNQCIRMSGSDVNHLKNVLRMKCGEEVWISDGEKNEFHCKIERFEEDAVFLNILETTTSEYELPNQLYLFQGLPKGDKMELIIQKAVELGVHQVIPVEMKRCVVKLDEKKAEKKIVRWQQISESAAKQSKRMLIPEIHSVMNYKEALQMAKKLDMILVPYELANGMKDTRELLKTIKKGQSVGIFIGAEGGFEEYEIEMAMECGANPITLGKRILRTETAGLAILSVLMFQLEEE